jgi:histidinol-phosphate/aromatic aminotransferase/cobyric acid decarboxylase-like protein
MNAAVPQSAMGAGASPPPDTHGGNRAAVARRLGCPPERLLDASASLVPFGPPSTVRRLLRRALAGGSPGAWLREYPDRGYGALRAVLAAHHGLEADWVLPGNGAAELFTWAARDAAAAGLSLLPTPGFADYRRALACWEGAWRPLPLPLAWGPCFPAPFPAGAGAGGEVLWLTNPHNPTGQLWSRRSLEALLPRFGLVICDEAFLPLVPGGEAESLVPLLPAQPRLVVIRSLTKLFAIAGLRLGYALGRPERLARWSGWRDPWPVNGAAAAVGEALLADAAALAAWTRRVQAWVGRVGPWLAAELARLPGLGPLPSAANFLLIRGTPRQGPAAADAAGEPASLEPLRRRLERRHLVLLRDCRSFEGLGEAWLRIGLQDRRGNRRIVRALRRCTLPAPA